jgi:hypothetical protein
MTAPVQLRRSGCRQHLEKTANKLAEAGNVRLFVMVSNEQALIGRDQHYNGAGLGGDLLVDALRRIALAAESVGIAATLLEVVDCGNPAHTARRKTLDKSYGFQSLSSNPSRLSLPLKAIRQLMTQL